jgi:hypothetical protein
MNITCIETPTGMQPARFSQTVSLAVFTPSAADHLRGEAKLRCRKRNPSSRGLVRMQKH